MKRARKRYVPPPTFAQQPKVAAVVKMMSRKRGATAEEMAAHLKWNAASIRAVVSRLGQVGAEIVGRRERGRGHVYALIERFTGRKDRTRLTKAQAAKLDRQGGFRPKLRG